jgi:hypothetical protein
MPGGESTTFVAEGTVVFVADPWAEIRVFLVFLAELGMGLVLILAGLGKDSAIGAFNFALVLS